MRLPFLRTKDPAAEPARAGPVAADSAAVEAARTRARQRLVGALVLLAVGIVGFPMLFDTQPRPLPVDTPMEVVRGDAASLPRPLPATPPAEPRPLALPPADAGVEMAPAASAPASPAPSAAAAVPASAAAMPAPPLAAPAPPPAAREAAARAPAPLAPAARASAPRTAAAGAAASAPRGSTTPAQAPAAVGRFVVQAGAYTDAAALRDARAKVEKLGLKTYTQVIEGDAGKRTRLRVGPYSSRQEADGVAARIKGAGLPTAVLAL